MILIDLINQINQLIKYIYRDVNKIKDGIGDKFGNGIQYFATFFICLIISLVRGWKLTLVVLSVSPLLFLSSALFTKVPRLMLFS